MCACSLKWSQVVCLAVLTLVLGFHFLCPDGLTQLGEDGHCQDIDECAGNDGPWPCMQRYHNIPGCLQMLQLFWLHPSRRRTKLLSECPPEYRKKPVTPPENSTVQKLKQECVDVKECLKNVCDWQCINLPGSHRCNCTRRYTLQKDGRRCTDINECKQKNRGCSHLYLKRVGDYKCACPASHRLSS